MRGNQPGPCVSALPAEATSASSEQTVFHLAVAGITLLAFALRLPALDPPSLFLDDAWVALLAREASLSDLLSLRPPHPVGFLLLLALAHRVVPNPELSLQLLPFAASLVLIPLGAWLVRRRTGGAGGGILAAALLAVNPALSAFSVRAKPYATDALLSLILLAAAAGCLEEPSTRRLGRLALLAALAVFFSFPAALVGAVSAVIAFAAAGRARLDRRVLIALAILFLLCEGVLGLLLLRGKANDSLVQYWDHAFVPRGSAGQAAAFMASRTVLLVSNSFPRGWEALGLLVPLALASLLARRATRPHSAILGALWAALVAAAAARLYPLESRTASFAYPIVVLLASGALAALARRLRTAFVAEGVPAFLALTILFSAASPVAYPPFDDARLVRGLASAARPGDAVLVYPHSNWSAGYYSGWPIELVASENYGTRFEAKLLEDSALTLPGVPGYENHPERLDEALRSFLGRHPSRVLYLATHLEVNCCEAHLHIQHALARAGYTRERLAQGPGAELLRFSIRPRGAGASNWSAHLPHVVPSLPF